MILLPVIKLGGSAKLSLSVSGIWELNRTRKMWLCLREVLSDLGAGVPWRLSDGALIELRATIFTFSKWFLFCWKRPVGGRKHDHYTFGLSAFSAAIRQRPSFPWTWFHMDGRPWIKSVRNSSIVKSYMESPPFSTWGNHTSMKPSASNHATPCFFFSVLFRFQRGPFARLGHSETSKACRWRKSVKM